MPKLLLTTPNGRARSIDLTSQLSVGRSSENTLPFPDNDGLSRQHLIFEPDQDHWVVRDLGSKNGTFVNGIRLTEKHLLAAADRVSAAGLEFVFDGPEGGPHTVVFERSADTATAESTHAVRLEDALTEIPGGARDRISPEWAFVRAGRELAVRRPLPELFALILDLALEAVHAERGVLLTLESGDQLIVRAARGGDFRISGTVRDRVLKERASVLIEDVPQESSLQLSEIISRHRVLSLMAVPLQTDDRVLGLIYVDTLSFRESFTRDDLNLLTVMANVAAIRIEQEGWESQRRFLLSENAATMSRLAAALSHEFNSPLGSLKSTVDTLMRVVAKQGAASGEELKRLEALQRILRRNLDQSLERLSEAICRIQRFTNLDRSELQAVNLGELITDVICLFRGPRTAPIRMEFEPEAIGPVLCRPQSLSAILNTLLHNAVEAVLRQDDREAWIRVSARLQAGMVDILIEDNGPGVEPEVLTDVFEPTFRVTGGRVAAGNWSLFSARQIMREDGGDLTLSSEHGKGTVVTISLPYRAAAPNARR